MVTLTSLAASDSATDKALAALSARVDPGSRPSFVCVFYDADHDDRLISAFIEQAFPDAAVIGGTSCGGMMSDAGHGGPGSIGLLLVDDSEGNYGTAAVRLDGDPADRAEEALRAALEDADCPGELPELIWIYQAPGTEEAVIAGLRRVVGDRCPIIGGSSADNTVQGRWRQLGPKGPIADGLVVAVLFPSGGVGFAFQGGYEPTGDSGIVTRTGAAGRGGRATGSREILSIDGLPAAEVYNRWTDGALDRRLAEGGSILADTTMYPLGVDTGRVGDVLHYLLVHPERILPGGGLSTFASIAEGTRIHAMCGDRARLVDRAGRVAAAAAANLSGGATNLAGSLIVYCGGCMLAVGEDMPKVSLAITGSVGATPFLGCFTFGEQGFMLDRNAHGNLMISAVAFGR